MLPPAKQRPASADIMLKYFLAHSKLYCALSGFQSDYS